MRKEGGRIFEGGGYEGGTANSSPQWKKNHSQILFLLIFIEQRAAIKPCREIIKYFKKYSLLAYYYNVCALGCWKYKN